MMTFNPSDPEFQHNPYPVYDELRATTPIFYWEPWKIWFFTRYEDINTLLRDRRLGRTMQHILPPEQRYVPSPTLEPFERLGQYSLFDKEPPEHTRLRGLVHKVFTPRRVEGLRLQIGNICNDLVDAVVETGQIEVLSDFAVPLPVNVISELLGVPEADRPLLRPWSNNIVAMYELDHTPEQERLAVQSSTEFTDYLGNLAAKRRAHPQGDLISALVQVEEAGERLTMDELIATCVLLLNAGHEATVNVIGNGLWALLHNTIQFQKLIRQPKLIPSAVEELMRYDTPLQLFRRWVLEDMEYGGYHFKQGDELGFMFGAANRDPARFNNPNGLDITREDNAHITFGGGVHYCLGAPLARLELQIAFETLLSRLPKLRLAGAIPTFKDAYVIRGLHDLRLRFDPVKA
ncbi:MAG: cytochrome P450 [Chloroflexota bacterium]